MSSRKPKPPQVEIPAVVLAEMNLAATALLYATAMREGNSSEQVRMRREQLATAALAFGREAQRVRTAFTAQERAQLEAMRGPGK